MSMLRACIGLSGILSACSARTFLADDRSAAAASVPSTLFVEESGGVCGEERDVESAADELRSVESGTETAVVAIAFADECTGAGGQYVLARDVDGGSEMWLGGHGCRFFDGALVGQPLVYGVARYQITAALFQVPPDVCVGFPGEAPGLTSSLKVDAVAVFASLEDARRFADDLEALP